MEARRTCLAGMMICADSALSVPAQRENADGGQGKHEKHTAQECSKNPDKQKQSPG
jgi:hypothetical protein